jgi:hypothetical protein
MNYTGLEHAGHPVGSESSGKYDSLNKASMACR